MFFFLDLIFFSFFFFFAKSFFFLFITVDELMTDPRNLRILSEMSTTEQMMAYMVKDSIHEVMKQTTGSKNGILPKKSPASLNHETEKTSSK